MSILYELGVLRTVTMSLDTCPAEETPKLRAGAQQVSKGSTLARWRQKPEEGEGKPESTTGCLTPGKLCSAIGALGHP